MNDPHYGCVFAAPLGSQQPIALGKSRIGRRGAVPARADVPARTTIPRRARLAGATVRLDRLLFEPMGRGELARPHRGRPGRALKLRRRAGGGLVAQAANRRGARVLLRRAGRRGRVAITLQLRGSQLRAPHACHALPGAISLQRPRVELRSRLRISAGKTRRLVRFGHAWRCARDRKRQHRPAREPTQPPLSRPWRARTDAPWATAGAAREDGTVRRRRAQPPHRRDALALVAVGRHRQLAPGRHGARARAAPRPRAQPELHPPRATHDRVALLRRRHSYRPRRPCRARPPVLARQRRRRAGFPPLRRARVRNERGSEPR